MIQGLPFTVLFMLFVVMSFSAQADQRAGINLLFSDRPLEQDIATPVIVEKKQTSSRSNKVSDPEKAPVDLASDNLEYDEKSGVVTAIGNVEIVQSGRILRAEEVSYNLNEDKVFAQGNVVLNEVSGDTYFAERVELTDEMKDGFVTGVRGMLIDGSRFTASEAEKVGDLKLIMRKASYTACELCQKNPDKAPPWQLKAQKVTHHKDDQRISYRDATFEVFGAPVLYTPYFSHADGSVKSKSGLLAPSFGFDSELGAFYQQDYYLNLAPEKDVTLGAVFFTDEAPLALAEYRQRFENAEITFNGGATFSSRIEADGDVNRLVDDETRGHLLAEGLWDINDKWRAGTNLALVTDDQYFRQYNITNDDVLENEVFVERFSDRDYSIGRLINFKDIRVSDRADDQPNVLPELYTRFLGDPNSLLGGRWSVEASALGLQREGNDQDVLRANTTLGWNRRFVSDTGVVTTVDVLSRGDAYRVSDLETASAGESSNSTALRGFARANVEAGYPLQKNVSTGSVVIEPLASVTTGTNVNENSDIPNEDSQDVFLDSTNLFNANRFPGLDLIEDDTHVTYGVRSGYYADNGHQAEAFLGQSYRLEGGSNPFPVGSGLSEQDSDIVGSMNLSFGRALQLGYGFQLANDNLSSRRHEIDMLSTIGPVTFGTRYFYADALQGTDLNESREQIRNSARVKFNDKWSVFADTQYDLAQETEGLRRFGYGFEYNGQCVDFLASASRRLINESTGESGTQLLFRIGLKNLGEFETSNITIGGSDGDDDDNDEDDFLTRVP